MFGQAAHRPPMGAFHRTFLIRTGIHQCGQLIEGEDDVRTQLVLNADGDLGREAVFVAVEVRAERHPVLVDMRQALFSLGDDVVGLQTGRIHRQHLLETHTERHHLEATTVGESRPGPVHERAEATRLVHHIGTRLQVQMVGIGQQRLRTKRFHGLGQDTLDRRRRADGNECRGLDITVRGVDHPGPAAPVRQSRGDLEELLTHRSIQSIPRAATQVRSFLSIFC